MKKKTIPADLVIAIDTSSSMGDEAEALSKAAEAAIAAAKKSCPSELEVTWLGLDGVWKNTNFKQKVADCLKERGADESALKILKSSNRSEDGVSAIEDIATHFPWRPEASRAIFYLSDEALNGSNTQVNEADADRAIQAASSNGVAVHTYFGTPQNPTNAEALKKEFARVSAETNGKAFTQEHALEGFTDLLEEVICATRDVSPPPVEEPAPAEESIPADLVIAIDTSGSMGDEAVALSKAAETAIEAAKNSCPSDLRVCWLGLEGTWNNTNFNRKVSDYLIKDCGADQSALRILKSTGDKQEDGASAIEDIANHYPWRSEASRAIFYLSDEAIDGSSINVNEEAADRAIRAAQSNGVAVHTYFGTGQVENTKALQEEFARVSNETKGKAFTNEHALKGFTDLLEEVICATREVLPKQPAPQSPKVCVDVVITCDTGSWTEAEAEGVCRAVEAEVERAASAESIDFQVVWLGLEGTWNGTQVTRTVGDYLTAECGVKKADLQAFKLRSGRCSGAGAIEDLVTHFGWRSGAKCSVLYLSRQGLHGGGSRVTKTATAAADRAIQAARAKSVGVCTFFAGTGSKKKAVREEYARVSTETRSSSFTGESTLSGLAEAVTGVTLAPPTDEASLTDLLTDLEKMIAGHTAVDAEFVSRSGTSFQAVGRLDEEQLKRYEASSEVLTQIQVEMEDLKSSISSAMSASMQSEDANAALMKGETAFRAWLAAMQTAVQKREEVQKSVQSILYELGAALTRVQATHRLFLAERDELWNVWTATQYGELSETAKLLIKTEREEKESALVEAGHLRKEVRSLRTQLKKAKSSLASVDVDAMRELERQLQDKLREQRTIQAELLGMRQRVEGRMGNYESRLERWRERESEWRRTLEKQSEQLRAEREQLEGATRENDLLLERARQAELELQGQMEMFRTDFVSKQFIETQYLHKTQVRTMIESVKGYFSQQIAELERGAEEHEDALEARLAWAARFSDSLDSLSTKLEQFEKLEGRVVTETTVESLSTKLGHFEGLHGQVITETTVPTERSESQLSVGQCLRVNQYLVSPSGKYFAIMQADGNFCIYEGNGPENQGKFVWGSVQAASYEPRLGEYFVIMQRDGNFCQYKGTPEKQGDFVWGTVQVGGYNPANGAYFAIMQDDSNFCVYEGSFKVGTIQNPV